jgi:hypothetical protein
MVFCTKKEQVYFLNMIGGEILNRELKAEFENAKQKAVLLPTCMSNPLSGMCKASRNGLEISCTSCSKVCNVNIIKQSINKHGVEVYLLPHSSTFSMFLENWKNNKELGLVGVGCVLNLLAGGYEMRRLNIPSQCVYLNYSGCRKHWHDKGIPTNLQLSQLHKILGIGVEKNEAVPERIEVLSA